MESKRDFSNWVKNKVLNNALFKENIDWIPVNRIYYTTITGVSAGGHNKKDYTLTLHTAMIVAKMNHTHLSAEVIRYFHKYNDEEVVVYRQKRPEYIFEEDIINNLFSDFEVISQYPVFGGRYRIDWYIKELNLAIEFDEAHHNYQSYADKIRQEEIENNLGCRFIRYKQTHLKRN